MNQVDFFKCLASPIRLKILKFILYKQSNVYVTELIDTFELDQPKISQHLARLKSCSILTSEKLGQWHYYGLNPNLPAWAKSIIEIIKDHADINEPL